MSVRRKRAGCEGRKVEEAERKRRLYRKKREVGAEYLAIGSADQ